MVEKKPTILYVDDEHQNLTAFTAAFRRYFNILTADSGRAGLDILRKENVSLIITDQRMPDMTGIQFLEAVIPEFPDSIRMILTGFTDVEAIIKAINTGRVYRYITKPWNEQEFRLQIDNALNIYNLEQKNKKLMLQLAEETARQQQIMTLFQKYVPANVLSEIFESKDSSPAIIQGENRITSVLFVDIRNFTGISSNHEPGEIVLFLNDYFTMINNKVKKHNGVINKFLADGVLAVFGAPRSYIDNTLNSVMAALEIVEAMPEFNAKWSEKLQSVITIGIGINTGEVVVGNMGSDDRIEYCVIGDTVNIAARVEELTKDKPNALLITEATYQGVKDKVVVECMGPQLLRGKEEGINVYIVKGRKQ